MKPVGARAGATALTLAVLLAACVPARHTPIETTATTRSDTPVTTEASIGNTITPGGSDTAERVDTPLGLLTRAGIPVAVRRGTSVGHWVVTPCGYDALVPEGEPIGPTSVVLDPGHGGPVDTGAVGPNGLPEKDLNLAIAELARDELAERGVDAVLTRTGDYASPLFVRSRLADSLQAEVMVSIHHNAPVASPSEEPGVEVFVQRGSDASRRLGGLLWEETMQALSRFDVAWVAAPDAGVMTVTNSRGDDAYGILRHPQTPSALVELGYIANPSEADLYLTDEYRRVAAEAVADAVIRYLESDSEGGGFVDGRTFDPQPGVGQDVCVDPDLG